MEEQPQNARAKQEEWEREEQFLRERMERWGPPRGGPFNPMFSPMQRKSKWIAGLCSFFVPGTGQLYLGLMQRGLSLMLLLLLNIVAIVFFSEHGNVPLIVMFSLFVPMIYFYNIFDALQQTDRVNGYAHHYGPYASKGAPGADAPPGLGPIDRPVGRLGRSGRFGYILIGAGLLLFLINGKPAWLDRMLEMVGSTVGAIVLIVIGLIMFYKESFRK